jgi:hypothetical protein
MVHGPGGVKTVVRGPRITRSLLVSAMVARPGVSAFAFSSASGVASQVSGLATHRRPERAGWVGREAVALLRAGRKTWTWGTLRMGAGFGCDAITRALLQGPGAPARPGYSVRRQRRGLSHPGETRPPAWLRRRGRSGSPGRAVPRRLARKFGLPLLICPLRARAARLRRGLAGQHYQSWSPGKERKENVSRSPRGCLLGMQLFRKGICC